MSIATVREDAVGESVVAVRASPEDLNYDQGCIYFNLLPLPSGKLSHNYGKSPFLMGKLTISMAIFNSYVSHNQRVIHIHPLLLVMLVMFSQYLFQSTTTRSLGFGDSAVSIRMLVGQKPQKKVLDAAGC